MKLTDNIEVNGLTEIVINREQIWRYSNLLDCWFYFSTENRFGQKGEYVQVTHQKMVKRIKGYLKNPKYRCWISFAPSNPSDSDFATQNQLTLNIVMSEKKKPKKPIQQNKITPCGTCHFCGRVTAILLQNVESSYVFCTVCKAMTPHGFGSDVMLKWDAWKGTINEFPRLPYRPCLMQEMIIFGHI